MTASVTIPKREYDILLKCKRIVESEFEGKFSEQFIKDIRKSEEEYAKGKFVRLKTSKELKKLFDSL